MGRELSVKIVAALDTSGVEFIEENGGGPRCAYHNEIAISWLS
jgi:hypothetical protein